MASVCGFSVSASFAFILLSRTTINRQHWVLAQDGANRAASRTNSTVRSSTGVVWYLRILHLVLIASISSIQLSPKSCYSSSHASLPIRETKRHPPKFSTIFLLRRLVILHNS